MNNLLGETLIDTEISDSYVNTKFQQTKNFLNSDSPLAIISFITFIFVMFYILIKLGSGILTKIFEPSKNVTLINGMIEAKNMMTISQDPNNKNSIPIVRSKNEEGGLEFTWSVWIYINDLEYKQNQYKHVFHKGEININTEKNLFGLNYPNNGPGLYIGPVKNELIVVMNTFKTIKEEIIIGDVPLNKWVNVIIRVDEQNILDVYINGVLARRHILDSVPKQITVMYIYLQMADFQAIHLI